MTSAVRAGRAFMELTLNSSQFKRSLDRVQRDLSQWGRGIQRVGASLVGVGAVGSGLFAPAITAAGDAQEVMSKFEVVFNSNRDEMRKFSDDLAATLGRSKTEVASFLASSQDLFVPIGFDEAEATNLSKTVTQLGFDLASFNNQLDSKAIDDIQAALTGSGEVMKKYGVIVSEAAVKQELLNSGFTSQSVASASEQAKVLARLSIILKGTTAAQGDAIRTSSSFNNSMKRLKSSLSDFLVSVGQPLQQALAPFATGLANVIVGVSQFVGNNQQLIVTVASVTAGIVAAGAAIFTLGTAMAGVAATMSVLGTATSAAASVLGVAGAVVSALVTPFGLLAAGVAALSVAFVDWGAAGSAALQFLQSQLGPLFATFSDGVAAMVSALSRGDIQAAANVLWATLELAWAQGTKTLTDAWSSAVQIMQATWIAFTGQMQQLWNTFTGGLNSGVASVISGLNETFAGVADFFGDNTLAQSLRAHADLYAQAAQDLQNSTQGAGRDIAAETQRQLDAIYSRSDSNIDELSKKLDLAKQQFTAAVAAANDTTTGAAGANPAAAPLADIGSLLNDLRANGQDTARALDRVVRSQGTFSGALASRVFGDTIDVGTKQLNEQKKTNQQLGILVDKAQAGNGLTFSG